MGKDTIHHKNGPDETDLKKVKAKPGFNTTSLAFMGDAVYEVFVREKVMELKKHKPEDMTRATITYVRAPAQAAAAKRMMADGFLLPEEERLLKRARNNTKTTTPRGATPAEYKLATGLEALIGHLYMAGETDRLREVCTRAVEIIEDNE